MSERLRVLIVEDSEDDALLLVRHLGTSGFDVTHERVETDAAMAAALARQSWDLVISDFQMPQFSAPAALQLLKKAGFDVPFIIASGTVGEEAAVAALKAGAQDFFVKGRLARLAPAIRRELADAESRRARRLAEEALHAGEERFRQMAENIDEVFWMSDPQKNEMLYVSPAYEAIWGRPCADLHVNAASWMEAIAPEDRERVREAAMTRQASGDYDEVYRILRPDGTARWIRDRAFPVRDAGGRVYRIAGIAEDITALKEAEAALHRSEVLLRQAQKMEAVGRLAGGVAHDFNNLLTVIQGYGAMTLERLRPEDPLHGYVEQIRDAADRAASLTRQLLAFSRKQVLKPRVLDLNEVVRNMDRLLRRLIGEDVTLVSVACKDLGRVNADPGQIEQVIVNLAVNSRDAMPHGGTLTLETQEADLDEAYVARQPGLTPGRYVVLSVSDTGTGMDEETKRHLFEPFFTTKEPGNGTGLGLSTVYGIVEQSRGHVAVCSELGRGTTFRVYLPRIDAPAARVKPVGAAPAPMRGTETILVVEDENAVRGLVCQVLRRSGYAVIEARGGKEAIAALRGHGGCVDLVLTDVVLAGMTGPDLVAKLSELGSESRILYMSGYTDTAILSQGVIRADTPYLQKPFTADVLLRHVREALGTASAAH